MSVLPLTTGVKYKNACEILKASSGRDDGEYEIQRLQQDLEERNRVIDQKDATIAEKHGNYNNVGRS